MERYEYLNGPPAPRMVAELAMRHDVLVKQLADAQATIAALQARLDERLEFIKDCDIALDRIQAPHTNEGQEELVSTWRRIELVGSLLSQYRSTLEQMSTQLTQRTAELEATEKAYQDKTRLYIEQTGAVADLQAELERVRDQYADLRKMVLALPKVSFRCEVDEKRDPEDDMFLMYGYTGSECHGTFAAFQSKETAQAVSALLQHRQGMEG